MARVLIPVIPRRYNHNPRGSSTSQVTMRGDNPFERPVGLVNRAMLPGMGALDIGATATAAGASAVDSQSGGFSWGGLINNLTNTAINVGGKLAEQALIKPVKPMTGPAITPLPIGLPTPAQKAGTATPLIIGACAIAGIGLFMAMKKRR